MGKLPLLHIEPDTVYRSWSSNSCPIHFHVKYAKFTSLQPTFTTLNGSNQCILCVGLLINIRFKDRKHGHFRGIFLLQAHVCVHTTICRTALNITVKIPSSLSCSQQLCSALTTLLIFYVIMYLCAISNNTESFLSHLLPNI